MKILTINMLLKKLIRNLNSEKKKIKISGIAENSKKVKKGYIFFAIKGFRSNGEKFIGEDIKNGATVIICSKTCKYKNNKIPVIKSSNVRLSLSEISSKFYKFKPKNIIAITGTNGKTSVADLFYQILNLNRIPVASIGTLGIKYKGKIIKSELTSPDTISNHQILEKLKKEKIENVIIETSSHGLHQSRMNHIKFKAGIFTNFSQDHLDYHGTMSSYLNAKKLLFTKVLSRRKVIISDKSIKEYSFLKKISKRRKLRLIDISLIEKKLIGKIPRLNNYQIKNLSMAIAAAKLCNVKEKNIYNCLKKIKDVNGRLELIKTFPNNVRVYVDFAHTPDALLKSLKALKSDRKDNITVVFGCGGDRDFKKRPLMAKIASSHCKKIFITDDNPRSEKPSKIRKQIIRNIKNPNCYDIGNRTEAIKNAILRADPNEIILVAGKGHEDKQIYKNKIIKSSDKKIIKSLKIKIKKISSREQTFIQNKKILQIFKKNFKFKNFHGLCIDSRLVKKNNLFVTIKGKNNDGYKFVADALKKGASYIISSRKNKKSQNKFIKVDNEIKFLRYFSSKKRENSAAEIIAITGSAGKTSLKNLTRVLLRNYGETFSSPKSYNNHFGVPLSLSQLNVDHKYGIFEVGMSKAGEINKLSKLVKPHIGIITNIGEAHIENFNNVKGIAKAKGELINHIKKNGTIILNKDDNYYNYFKKKSEQKNLKVVSFGYNNNADVYPVRITKFKKNKRITLKIKDQFLNVEVRNLNIYNILALFALLKELKLDLQKAIKILKKCEPSEGRGKIHNIKRYKKKFKLIDESYNANPLSVKNAISNFNSIKKKKFKKYLLLGDMLELGKKSNSLHENLSKVINNSDIDKVFVKGTKTLVTYKKINKEKRGNIFQLEEDVDFTLNNIISNNDYLMIKGSNATGLNNLSKRIIRGY